MIHYIMSDSVGNIIQVGSCGAESYATLQNVMPTGISLITVISPVTDFSEFILSNYCLDSAVVSKAVIAATVSSSSIVANGVSSSTISGLPIPCTVSINGVLSLAPTAVTDGVIVITSDSPGEIIITVKSAPAFLPWNTTINAT
jgi:hypothetical protein